MDLTFQLLPFVFLLGIKIDTLPALPVITPEESEYIVKAKDDFKLTCKSDVNVTWTYLEVVVLLELGISNINLTFYRESDIYVAELSITNVSGRNVGYYFCNETDNPENVASLYLYVDDDERLSFAQNLLFIWGRKLKPLVIACKPTHPSVEVNLYSGPYIDGEIKGTLIHTGTDSQWTYNPKRGFILTNLTQFSSVLYTCLYQKNGANDYQQEARIVTGRNIEIASDRKLTTSCHQRCEWIFWSLYVVSFSQPVHIEWFDPHEKRIEDNEKFTIIRSAWTSGLILTNITIKDRGNYSLVARNGFHNKSVMVFLNITAKPSVEIIKDPFHMVGSTETVKCIVWAFPPPEIKWEFKGCIDSGCEYKPLISSETVDHDVYTSTVAVGTNQSGYIKCVASNVYGSDDHISDYTVTDVKNGFNILIKEDDIEFPTKNQQKLQLAAGSQVQLGCLATVRNYSSRIEWYFDYSLIRHDLAIQTTKTTFSVKHFFIIRKVGRDNAGLYICETRTVPENRQQTHTVSIEVVAPQKPRITVTNMDQAHEKVYPNTDNFTCLYEGVPRASIKWYKDGSEFLPDNTRVKFENMMQVLLFIKPNYTTEEGVYTCRVTNRLGSTSRTATLKFANKPSDSNISIYVPLGIFFAILVAVVASLIYKIRKKRQLRILRAAVLENFEKGAVERINPNLGVDDQAQLLPYNKKSWEIPKERVKLGEQLGAGAFGVVMKAVVERYDNNTDLKVAVKMMKMNADDIYLMALLSELKIMVHLGKHLNVVNLIGACTQDIAKRELYIIVEFCPFGNLRNYLLHHRENFINQIDPETKTINYSIGADVLSLSVASDNSFEGPPKGIEEDMTNSIYVRETAVSMTSDKNQDKPTVKNSIPLKERTTCKDDYKRNIKPICTQDLLIWAFQVSRGMEYLASRRVLHSDLASRNILLADKNVVKICDFGLSKRMYKNNDYKRKGRGPLPFKWMSIESMRDRVFSTQSDVWSFGIVLWEFFSLARTPYPGMEAGESILQKLIEGYRMDQPTYATKEIYSLMLKCWETAPPSRPTFQELSDRIGSMLEESVRKFYIDLNEPYLVMNKQRIQSGQNDYLQMVSSPDFKTLSSANHPPRTMNTAQYNYMPKRSRPLFNSPKPQGKGFSFSELNSKNLHSPKATPIHTSDYEADRNT